MQDRQLHLIHIDDNDEHAELVREALTGCSLSCSVSRFVDAESGLRTLEWMAHRKSLRQKSTPDLILLETELPGMSGLEFLEQVRSIESLKAVPIVVLSSSDCPEMIARAYRAGVNSYIVKPPNFGDFLVKLAELSMYWALTAELPVMPMAS